MNEKGGYSFASVLPVTLDSVQEFRAYHQQLRGRIKAFSSAAQVALVTKSGTNRLHGSVYEYNRNSYTSENDYFINAARLAVATLPINRRN